jgi:hypothetical protein
MKLKTPHLINSQRSILTAAFFLSLLTSCKKNDDFGLPVQPQEDQLQGMLAENFTLNTHTVLADSLRSDELDQVMLGQINDPVFGVTKSGFYTQIRLEANAPGFDPADIIVDSIVLHLPFAGYYGNVDEQTFHVYEVLDTMSKDSAYYTNTTLDVDPTDLVESGYGTFTPNIVDYYEDPITGDSTIPALRLRLKNSLAQRFIDEGPGSNLNDNTTFTNWFKGLYITADAAGEGGLFYFDLLEENTEVTMYYREISTGDTIRFSFLINENAARFTSVSHDYSGTVIAQQLADTTLGQNFFYLQGGAGLSAELRIPDLSSITADGPVVVNLAELTLPVQYFNLDPFAPAPQILILGLDEDGESYLLTDINDGDVTFGGTYDDSRKLYRFSIGRHINQVLNGTKPNYGFKIVVVASAITAYRSIMSGANSDNRDKPKLSIIYTKY